MKSPEKLPYKVFKIKGKKSWYYQFLIKSDDGKAHWTLRKALKGSANYDRFRAVSEILDIYANGGRELAGVDLVKKCDWTRESAAAVCTFFRKNGLIADFQPLTDTTAILFVDFMFKFFSPESERSKDFKRKGKELSRSRYQSAERMTRLYYAPFFDGVRLADMTRAKFKEFSDWLQSKDISNTTRNHILKIGKTALKWAYVQDLLGIDVSVGDYLYKDDTKETLIFSVDLARRFFVAAQNMPVHHYFINALAAVSGMRPGEILALKKEDLGDHEIYLRHSWDGETMRPPKNGKERRILISDSMQWILNGLKKLAAGSFCGLVFESPTDRRKPISKATVQKVFHRYLKKVIPPEEAKKYKFYQWRHFHDTYMINNGLDARTLARQSGHNADLIMELYANHETAEADFKLLDVQARSFSGLFPDK